MNNKGVSLKYFTELLWEMTIKEIKTRYKKAIFGFFWIVLNPVLQMATIGLVFQYVTKIPIDNYFFFLFAGLLPWNMFSYTVIKNSQAIVFERSLLQKAKFPSETIVLSIVLSNAFHTLISIFLILPLLWWSDVAKMADAIWLVPAFLWLFGITSGLSLLLAALNVRFRDINFFTQALIPLWFYATPVLYLLSFFPTQMRGLAYLNPMTGVVELFHRGMLGGGIDNPAGMILSLTVSVLITVLSVLVYRRESKYFVDWL